MLSTLPSGINAAGDVAGTVADTQASLHGLVRKADGTIAAFDVPNAALTSAGGINRKGQIAGAARTAPSIPST